VTAIDLLAKICPDVIALPADATTNAFLTLGFPTSVAIPVEAPVTLRRITGCPTSVALPADIPVKDLRAVSVPVVRARPEVIPVIFLIEAPLSIKPLVTATPTDKRFPRSTFLDDCPTSVATPTAVPKRLGRFSIVTTTDDVPAESAVIDLFLLIPGEGLTPHPAL
jgi:hypothetical protein